MADSSENDPTLRAFRERWRSDRDQGIERSLEEYASLHPGPLERLAAAFFGLRSQERTESEDEPTTIGPYRTLRELGRGGQGVVHLAEDTRFGRKVALKVLNEVGARGEEVLARFRREALVASRLNHPGICAVLDAEVEGGVPYIAMPYIEGKTLAARIAEARRGPEVSTARDSRGEAAANAETTIRVVPEPGTTRRSAASPEPVSASTSVGRSEIAALLEIFEHLARALHAAHEAGVVHRDLKPGNILIRPDGAPILLDFGLAMADDHDLQPLTRTGDLFGTPQYMSPEQVDPKAPPLDRRTDIYSLGVALFEAVALRRPFVTPSRKALFHAILTEEAPDVRALNPRATRDLAIVLAKMLERDRDQRYASAETVAEELARVRTRQPILARPVGSITRTKRWAQRNPIVATLLAALLLVLTTATALTNAARGEAEDALSSRTTALERMTEARDAEQTAREAKQRALESERAAVREKTATLLEYERLADSRRLGEAKAERDRLWPVSPALIPAIERWRARYGSLLRPRTLADHEAALEALRGQALPDTEAFRREDWAAERAEIDVLAAMEARLETRLKERKARASGFLARLAGGDSKEIAKAEKSLAELRKRLAGLREAVQEQRSWRFRTTDEAFRHEILARLVSELREFVAQVRAHPQQSLPSRAARARRLAEQTLESPAARQKWKDTLARVRANPRYRLSAEQREALGPIGAPVGLFDATGAMTLSPQFGLLPLGPDPRSGLEEFLHIETHGDAEQEVGIRGPKRRAITEEDPRGGFEMEPSTGIVFVLVPAGTFSMGAQKRSARKPNHDPGIKSDSTPVHPVSLGAYFLAKYELTQAQWARGAERTGSARPHPSDYGIGAWDMRTRDRSSKVGGTHPVENVSWRMSSEWCRRLGLQLPTEAQWERAARADHPRTRWAGVGSVEETDGIANLCGAESAHVVPGGTRFTREHRDDFLIHAPVGMFAPNGYGLHDMTGNVFEWCRDPYSPGAYSDFAPRPGDGLRAALHSSPMHAYRGGSWSSPAARASVAFRLSYAPTMKDSFCGLRAARALSVP